MTPDAPGSVPGADRVPADLRRQGWWGRFPAATESDYRVWLAAQVAPLLAGVGTISLVFWALLPLAAVTVLPATPAIRSVWVISAICVVTIVVGLMLLRRHPENAVALAMIGLLVTGGCTIYLMSTDIGIGGEGFVVVAAVFMSLLCALVQLPARQTSLAVLGFSGSAAVVLSRESFDGRASFSSFTPTVWLVISAVMVTGMALLAEQRSRAKFVDERIITLQGSLIRRYVPPAVADRIERGDAVSVDVPQRRRVTILSSDVVGFTDLADRVDPETLTQVINEYLGALAGIVDRHRGTLNEFAGDGVLALFGAPADQPPDDQVASAVAAAQEIQATLSDLNPQWLKLGIDQPIRTRIGINTGVISVGSFGSQGRATYTGIGLQANIAARIQAECDPGGILLSHSSWQLVKDVLRCEPRGDLTVKGVHYPIQVFAPEVQKRRSEGSSMPRSAS